MGGPAEDAEHVGRQGGRSLSFPRRVLLDQDRYVVEGPFSFRRCSSLMATAASSRRPDARHRVLLAVVAHPAEGDHRLGCRPRHSSTRPASMGLGPLGLGEDAGAAPSRSHLSGDRKADSDAPGLDASVSAAPPDQPLVASSYSARIIARGRMRAPLVASSACALFENSIAGLRNPRRAPPRLLENARACRRRLSCGSSGSCGVSPTLPLPFRFATGHARFFPLDRPRHRPQLRATICTLIVGPADPASRPDSSTREPGGGEIARPPAVSPYALVREPLIVGGRDSVAGGTWLGFQVGRLVVAILNRNTPEGDASRWVAGSEPDRSRGLLCLDALRMNSAREAADWVKDEVLTCRYAPFTLFIADARDALAASWDGRQSMICFPAGTCSPPRRGRPVRRALRLATLASSRHPSCRGPGAAASSHEGSPRVPSQLPPRTFSSSMSTSTDLGRRRYARARGRAAPVSGHLALLVDWRPLGPLPMRFR